MKQKQQAQQTALGQVQGAQQYLPSGLTAIEELLRHKSGLDKPQISGQSELFNQLGIGGFGALTAQLSQAAAENQARYGSFVNAMNAIGTQFQNEFNAKLSAYNIANQEYNDLVTRVDDKLASTGTISA